MSEKVKIYEEKKKGPAIWAWLVPLLLLAVLAAYFLTRHKDEPQVTQAPASQVAPAAAFPDLGTVHFDTNQATLTQDSKETLDKAADVMKSNPNAHIRLEGYTDSTGSDTHNLSLSQQRAITVAEYLKAKGLDGSRLTGNGFGPNNPADTNATDAGKADNRRVELFSQQ